MSTPPRRSLESRVRRRWSIVRANWRDISRETIELLGWESTRRRVGMQALAGIGVLLAIYDFIVGKPGLFIGFFMLVTVLMASILFFLALAHSGVLVAPEDRPSREDSAIDSAAILLTIPVAYFSLWSAMRMWWSLIRFIGYEVLGPVVLALFAHAVFLAVTPPRLRLRHDALDVFGGLLVASPVLVAAYYFGGADREATIMLVVAVAVGVVTRREAVARLGLNLLVALLVALARVSPRALDLVPVGAVRRYGCAAFVWALRAASRGRPRRLHTWMDALGPQLPLHAVRLLQVRAIRSALRARAYAAIGERSLPLLGLRDRSEPYWLSTLVAAAQLHAEVCGRRVGATRALLVEELAVTLEDCYITLNRELQGPAPCPSGVEAFELLGDWIAAVRGIGAER